MQKCPFDAKREGSPGPSRGWRSFQRSELAALADDRHRVALALVERVEGAQELAPAS